MMKFVFALLLFAAAMTGAQAAIPERGTPVFAVVMTRHGVRSFTHAPAAYTWPDWQPVAPGYLTAHGYRLMTMMGGFYRSYFAAAGLPFDCEHGGLYVYADLDQRTLATAKGLIEGACGRADAIPYAHAAQMGPGAHDDLFDGVDALGPAGKIDRAASRAAVAAAAPVPPSALVQQHAAAFAAVQRLVDPLCTAGSCPPATQGASTIVQAKSGLAELAGPLDTGSSYAESLFLMQAECARPVDDALLERAMSLHVLEYAINARNAYTPLAKGGTMFAHIVGLLQARAGMTHPDVTLAPIGDARVVMLSGHDTQLGALGGILHAHWQPAGDIAADDMPPGGALIFELDRMASGEYVVDVRFASPTMAQFRSDRALPGGMQTVPVLRMPLAQMAALAHDLAQRGFVQRDWTPLSDTPPVLAPLADPAWSHCT